MNPIKQKITDIMCDKFDIESPTAGMYAREAVDQLVELVETAQTKVMMEDAVNFSKQIKELRDWVEENKEQAENKSLVIPTYMVRVYGNDGLLSKLSEMEEGK